MSDNVVRIGGDTVLPNEADPYLIETLQQLLEHAKSGELRGVAYATVYGRDNGSVGTGWSGGAGTQHVLSTGVSMLQIEYTRSMMEGGL